MARTVTALLAFDTATERKHAGLAVGGSSWLRDGEGGAQASGQLIACLLQLLADAGITVRDLDAIAFGCGPGAFTGLRTACSVAQGLALGAGKPIIAIDTLMAVAEDTRARIGVDDVWVAMDARMDEVYAARYRHVAGQWQPMEKPALYTLPALHAQWQTRPPLCVAGTAVSAFGERLRVGAAPTLADAMPRAQALLALAKVQWSQGGIADAGQALPRYLRDKVALTTQEREAVKAAD